LKSPEIAERGATPAIETALHGENAVEFSGGERNGDAPEKGDEGEKQDRHARAGIVEDSFITEGTAGGVAVKKRQEREEADLAKMGVLGRKRLLDFTLGFGH